MIKTESIQITPELLALLSEIDEFKGAWRALGTLAPDRLKALRRLATKVEREKNALSALSELAVKILDYVHDHGRVATRDMVRETGASPNTLKATFTSLVEKNLLARHGGGRSTWYGVP